MRKIRSHTRENKTNGWRRCEIGHFRRYYVSAHGLVADAPSPFAPPISSPRSFRQKPVQKLLNRHRHLLPANPCTRPQRVLGALPLPTAPKTPGAPNFPALLEKTPSPSPSPESTCSSTASSSTKPLQQSKPGLIHRPRLADRALNLLSHPLIRRALYYLLWVCIVIEEYLIRILIEE